MKKYRIQATDEGMTIKVVNTHGGARAGAGRKAYGTTLVSWRVSEAAKEWIKTQAQEQGVTTARIIDELIRSFEEQANA